MPNRRNFRGPRQRRKFVWARVSLDQIVAAEDADMINLLQDFESEMAANLVGATVMRLRGELEFEPASAATAVCAAGVIVASQNVYTGISAGAQTHGPKSDLHADWMAYEPIIFNDNDPTRQVKRWEIDVKSSRKVEELGDALMLLVENDIVGVALTVRGIVSVGLKLA